MSDSEETRFFRPWSGDDASDATSTTSDESHNSASHIHVDEQSTNLQMETDGRVSVASSTDYSNSYCSSDNDIVDRSCSASSAESPNNNVLNELRNMTLGHVHYNGIQPAIPTSGLWTDESAFHRPSAFRSPGQIQQNAHSDRTFSEQYNLMSQIQEAVNRLNRQEAVVKRLKKLRPKKFKCPHCPMAFSNNGQRKGHIRIHTGERPFKCNFKNCGKAFTRNEELTRHKRIHSGLKPYSCVVCRKPFGRKDHLAKHTRIHENRNAYYLAEAATRAAAASAAVHAATAAVQAAAAGQVAPVPYGDYVFLPPPVIPYVYSA